MQIWQSIYRGLCFLLGWRFLGLVRGAAFSGGPLRPADDNLLCCRLWRRGSQLCFDDCAWGGRLVPLSSLRELQLGSARGDVYRIVVTNGLRSDSCTMQKCYAKAEHCLTEFRALGNCPNRTAARVEAYCAGVIGVWRNLRMSGPAGSPQPDTVLCVNLAEVGPHYVKFGLSAEAELQCELERIRGEHAGCQLLVRLPDRREVLANSVYEFLQARGTDAVL